jgi:hypothetical protein
MADQPPEPHVMAAVKLLASFGPGAAGTVLALMLAQNLTWRGVLVSAFAGLACVLLVAPALTIVAAATWPWGELPTAIVNLIGFVCGLLGMAVVSGLVQAAARYSKNPMAWVRVKLGPVEIGETGAGEVNP